MKTNLFIFISFFFLISCTLAPPPRPEPVNIINSITLTKPYEEVWIELIEYRSSRQIQIKTIDKNSGFIDTDFMELDYQILADYAWTGTRLPSAGYPKGKIKANIFIKKIGGAETKINVNTNVSVFLNGMGSTLVPDQWINAKSTGKFESDILNIFK